MKIITFLLIASIAFASIAIPAFAQINRNGGNSVSNLGNINASSKSEAIRKCTSKGGNILIHHGDGVYSCYYSQSIERK